MKFQEAHTIAKKYSSVIRVNTLVPQFFREIIINFSFVLFFIDAITLYYIQYGSHYVNIPEQYRYIVIGLTSYRNIFLLFLFIFFIIFILMYSLHVYSRYFMFKSIQRLFGSSKDRLLISYEVALVLVTSTKGTFVNRLLDVPESRFIVNRLLLTTSDIAKYDAHVMIDMDTEVLEYNSTVTLGSLWKLLYEHCEEFRNDLLSRKIQKDIFNDTCNWLDRILEDDKKNSAWWWRENLSKIRGIGKSLTYGEANFISKYARELGIYGPEEELGKIQLHKESIEQLENVLARSHKANAVIVGNRGVGRHSIVKIVAKMIEQGSCYSEIEHKRVFEFDMDLLLDLNANELNTVLNHCCEEAIISRNIIFVINDFPVLYDAGQKQGVDVFQILEKYLHHKDISLVCICDQSFYQNEKHKIIFDRDFEFVHVGDINTTLLIPYLQDYVMIIETLTGKFFPSHSINTIASVLAKYCIEDSPLVKAGDLLHTIADTYSMKDHILVDEESVSETIKSLIGVSTGEIKSDEREKLLNLESILHKKIIGQYEAIKVISDTMRRSRAGLAGGTKPIGSFLFFGPTGVGKTETAKTLASVFFGNENYMSRIDMNEYTMSDSSHTLLGYENNEGDISRHIHERPYGVLLLDEFEKATTEVKDIFLRILDEGVFTNGAGKLISARTQIIIATSNAGSQYLRESGIHQDSTKDEIEKIKSTLVDTVIRDGLFRPELLNRFDAIVVFHPLGDSSKIEITRKMLKTLEKRSLDQGYTITFTDALVQKIAEESDTMFGGRAIQRNIQTEIESMLARKIIEGGIVSGGSIVLDVEDVK